MMTLSRRALLAIMLAIPLAGTILRPARANEPPIYAPGGIAISGYDPVAYFTLNRPVRGTAEHALWWRGAMWYFINGQNLQLFEMNPAAYAPQYGGYCAYALSRGTLLSSSPEAFTIHNGALYLKHSMEFRTIWRQDMNGNIRRADANWPTILHR
jgi:YHS domain-containing protein